MEGDGGSVAGWRSGEGAAEGVWAGTVAGAVGRGCGRRWPFRCLSTAGGGGIGPNVLPGLRLINNFLLPLRRQVL